MSFVSRTLGIAAVVVALSGVALAGEKPKREMRGPVDGEVAAKQVATLLGAVPWRHSIEAAKAAAAKEGKLILWVHVLGDLDGAT